jgi:hypothetical protein
MNAEDEIRINAYLDVELTLEAKREVEALLRRDSEARAYLDQLAAVQVIISKHTIPHQPNVDEEWEAVLAKLHTCGRGDNNEGRTIPFTLKVAALAAVVSAGFFAWYSLSTKAPSLEHLQYSNEIEIVETTIENASSVIYVDEPSGWTVVWVTEEPYEDDNVI